MVANARNLPACVGSVVGPSGIFARETMMETEHAHIVEENELGHLPDIEVPSFANERGTKKSKRERESERGRE